ncbi:MAG: hypothetical protein D6704_00485 [Nitrospirae bacterium]|nr:MAG: hypothetical protein D6704_00485 [Nitrospirota bacterium]
MKLANLLEHFAQTLSQEKETVQASNLDAPIETADSRHVATAGTLHLYAVRLPQPAALCEDVPVTVVPPGDLEPTEGCILHCEAQELIIQTCDPLGPATQANTLVPDTAGFLETAAIRLAEMAAKPESYALGPAERLLPWLDPEHSEGITQPSVSTSVLTTVWHEDPATRWHTLGSLVVECIRQNKRILLLAPCHRTRDELVGFLAKTLRAAALPFKSLVSCYEVPILPHAWGMPLAELGFEAQMHGFFAKSRANKEALRKQYNRFRELTPILAYKVQKQKDLNEVKLLEWRLLAEVGDYQRKIKEIDKLIADYERLPIWTRLGMQALGKNVTTLGEYRRLYEQKIQALMKEVEIAQARIRELTPEAAMPKELRPEYEALKEEITRLGGTQKIRELLAAGEGTNRQAFIQNKRLVASTPGRVVTDPVFTRVRFDVLIAEEAPRIPAPFLLGAAGLIRERIILAGNTQDLDDPHRGRHWRQHALDRVSRSSNAAPV